MTDKRETTLRAAAEGHVAAGRLASARLFYDALDKGGSATEADRAASAEAARALDGDVPPLDTAARLAREGRADRAIRAYQSILRATPDNVAAAVNLSSLYRGLGRLEDAVAACRTGLEKRPHDPALNFNLGVVLHESGRPADALKAYGLAVAHRPDWPEAFYNMGVVATDRDRDATAADFYRQALALRPDYAEAWNNLGNVLRDLGDFPAAVDAFDRALAVRADHPTARFNRGLARLTAGHYEAGWEDYATRFEDAKIARLGGYADFGLPRWDGTPFAGRTLLVQSEQGSGDTLQFLRYLPEVKARGGRVVLYCQDSLAGLLAGAEGADAVVPRVAGGSPPPADLQVPMMDLPRLFGTTLAAVPWPGPYIWPSEEARARFAAWERPEGLAVGVVWSGNPRNKANRHRALRLDWLAPMAAVEGVHLVSLQKGPPASEAAAPPAGMKIVDLGDRLESFDDTAAAIERLDLVVTVCTSVAHLAGAMGAPCWTLLHRVPDWRWGAEGEESAWYPGMRLFRQARRGDWNDVVARVAAALDERVRRGGEPAPG